MVPVELVDPCPVPIVPLVVPVVLVPDWSVPMVPLVEPVVPAVPVVPP
jgi:hypothetical protein